MHAHPTPDELALLAMESLERPKADVLRAHLAECDACQAAFAAARGTHARRIASYEAFDHDHDRLRARLRAALPEDAPAAAPRVTDIQHLGATVMTLSRRPLVGAAAVLAPAACIVAALLFWPGASPSAFAQVVERLRHADRVHCGIVLDVVMGPMRQNATGQIFMSESMGTRVDVFAGESLLSQVYVSPDGHDVISLAPTANMVTYVDASAVADLPEANRPDQFIRQLMEIPHNAAVTEAAPVEEDGRILLAFELPVAELSRTHTMLEGAARLYVDAESMLPHRFEMNFTSTYSGGFEGRVTYLDFDWRPNLEPAVFEPQIPEDSLAIHLTIPPIDESSFIRAMQFFAESTGGSYPLALDNQMELQSAAAASVAVEIAKIAAKKDADQPAPQQVIAETAGQRALDLTGAMLFYMTLLGEERQPEYFGDDVSALDPDGVLLQYRLEDGDLRVIYGDLSAETIPAAQISRRGISSTEP